MKKVFPRIIFLIIVLIIFIGLAPRFLILEDVQGRFTSQISKSLGSPLTVNKMYWIWLPLPHLTLVNTTITNENYYLSLPRVNIYPTCASFSAKQINQEKLFWTTLKFISIKQHFCP